MQLVRIIVLIALGIVIIPLLLVIDVVAFFSGQATCLECELHEYLSTSSLTFAYIRSISG